MKKKRIVFLLTLSGLLTSFGISAQGAYVSLNAGYGFNASSQNIGTIMYTNDGSNTTTFNQEDISFGKGFIFGGAAGYMFTGNLGVEVGFSSLTGDHTTLNSSFVKGTDVVDFSSSMIRFNPSIVLATGMKGINPYARFGVIIGMGSIIETDKYTENPNSSTATMKLNGGNAVGLTAALGAQIKLTGRISIFGELAMVNMSYAPTRGEITAYSFNGIDKMSSLKPREILTDYVESYTVTANQTTPDNEPTKSLLQKFPFGSLGINIGLKYDL